MTTESAQVRILGRLARAAIAIFSVSRFTGGGEELISSREFDNLVLDQIYWHLLIERIMTRNVDELPDYMARLRSELQGN